MGLFIRLDMDRTRCSGTASCGRCVQVCPVGIFAPADGPPRIVADNEDECTLCDLCLQACEPGAIILRRLYEDGVKGNR